MSARPLLAMSLFVLGMVNGLFAAVTNSVLFGAFALFFAVAGWALVVY